MSEEFGQSTRVASIAALVIVGALLLTLGRCAYNFVVGAVTFRIVNESTVPASVRIVGIPGDPLIVVQLAPGETKTLWRRPEGDADPTITAELPGARPRVESLGYVTNGMNTEFRVKITSAEMFVYD